MWEWGQDEPAGCMSISSGFLALTGICSSPMIFQFPFQIFEGKLSHYPQDKETHKKHRQSSPSMQTQNPFKTIIQGAISLHQITCPSLLAELCLLLMAIQEFTIFALWVCIENALKKKKSCPLHCSAHLPMK